MIGDKLLSVPKTVGEAKNIHNELGLGCNIVKDDYLFDNAYKLVEMNNEIYDKHKNITWLKEQIGIIEETK